MSLEKSSPHEYYDDNDDDDYMAEMRACLDNPMK